MDERNLSDTATIVANMGRPGEDGAATSLAEPQSRPAYADLVAFFEANEATKLSTQQASNRVSALNQFLKSKGLDLGSEVGQELGDAFDVELSAFIKAGKLEGKQDGTLANRKTWLRQWRRTWQTLVERWSAPKFASFVDAYLHYFELARANGYGKSHRAFSMQSGLRDAYLQHAVLKRYQNPRIGLDKCASLEKLLRVPPSTLSRFIPQEKGGIDKIRLDKAQSTNFGKELAALIATPYALNDLTPNLKAELREVLLFKTAITVAPLKRNEPWRLQPKEKFSGPSDDWFGLCSPDGKHFAVTCLRLHSDMRSFFGFLKIEGFDENKFSLAYMADFGLMSRYLGFMRGRRGKLTSNAADVVGSAMSLLYDKGGYLYQQPKFGAKLLTPVAPGDWMAWCTSQTNLFLELEEQLKKGKQVKIGRDVVEPIKDILDRDHPITALFEMAENMRRYIERYEDTIGTKGAIFKATLERDLLLVKIIVQQPLRIKMFKDMTYRDDNSGSLYKRATGVWAIKFRPEDFKNQTGAAQKPYDVPLPKKLWDGIERYLKEVRPIFNDASDSVFVSLPHSRKPADRKTLLLNDTFRKRTRQFIPGCPGFGPQAVRHIVATDYIKNNPNGFQVAADVLHDMLQTVVENYAHLKAADGHKFYQSFADEVEKEWRTGQ